MLAVDRYEFGSGFTRFFHNAVAVHDKRFFVCERNALFAVKRGKRRLEPAYADKRIDKHIARSLGSDSFKLLLACYHL